jgi:hypothetical protein
VLRTSGTPLDSGTRSFMESRLGRDFSRVRVHSGADAAEAAESVGARAYTVGPQIVFGAGEFRPHTDAGRRLLAHELTHVTQQNASGTIRRDKDPAPAKDKAPKAGSAAAAPRLDYKPAANTPVGACLVFMHHDEANAHLYAESMYKHCRYNLAIVAGNDPGVRRVKLGKGDIDPNELFPQDVAEECWTDTGPCETYVAAHKDDTDPKTVRKSMERQFFVAIHKCSQGFKLPVVGLHNNAIEDTARYRAARDARAKTLAAAKAKAPGTPPPTTAPDLDAVRGKTYVSPGEIAPEGSKPFADPKVADGIKHKKPTLKTPATEKTSDDRDKPELLTPKQTNIFLWCSADDNTLCSIGDPERPDNVVWVTNRDDFEKLAPTKVNVVLQTSDEDTDLSTLFIKLPKISEEFKKFREQLEKDLPIEAAALVRTYASLQDLSLARDTFSPKAWARLAGVLMPTLAVMSRWQMLLNAQAVTPLDEKKLHFINVETPKQPTQGESPEDLRTQSFRDVKNTLATIKLDFCDDTAPAGEKTPTQKVEADVEAKNAATKAAREAKRKKK